MPTRLTNYPRSIFIFLLFLLLFSATSLKAATKEIEVSPSDTRLYRAVTLENELKVLLISDPDSSKAAASMNINVGSNGDPEPFPGLAHFLEHMLFLGTDKYPTADEYQSFISTHGGQHNAYTAFESTNYFFDITAPHFEDALDRFSRFFIAPNFDAHYINRESNAVDSEYQSKIKDDGRRIYAASKQAYNPDHPYSRFTVGNLSTLKDQPEQPIREALIDFYQRYYSANMMSLVVLGPQTLEQLEQMVRSRFSEIKNTQATPPELPASLFQKDRLPALLNIETLADIRQLSFHFPIDAIEPHWKNKPSYFIASQLGYEGRGSLLSLLKEKGWATSLSASPSLSLPQAAQFTISIGLTPQGFDQYQEVTRLLFEAIYQLRDQGVVEARFNEDRKLAELAFRFQEKQEPIHWVSILASQLHQYPTELVIKAPYLHQEFDANLIRHFLDQLTPDNLLLVRQGQQLATDQTEFWYQVPYSLSPLDEAFLLSLKEQQQINPALTVRAANPFIPEDLNIKPLTSKSERPTPLSIDSVAGWHLQDSTFLKPKSDLFIGVLTPLAVDSVEHNLLTELIISMVEEQLNETVYDASLAGLGVNLYNHLRGFTIKVSGYNDKLPVLVNQLTQMLSEANFNPSLFEIKKDQLKRNLENSRKEKPYIQGMRTLYDQLLNRWSDEAKLKAIEGIQFAQLAPFSRELLNSAHYRLLSHGNITEEESIKLSQQVIDQLCSGCPLKTSRDITPKVIEEKTELQLTIDHKDAAIIYYLQAEQIGWQGVADYMLLAEILSAPFYSELRTEQQLGYIVFANAMPVLQHGGMAMIIQSPVAQPKELELAIDQFLDQFIQSLEKMDQQQIDQYRKSLLINLEQPDNSLTERTNRFWRELDQKGGFAAKELLAEALNNVSKDTLLNILQQRQRSLIISSAGQR